MNKENSKIPSKLPGLHVKTVAIEPSFPVPVSKRPVAKPISRTTRATSATVSSLSKTTKTIKSTAKPAPTKPPVKPTRSNPEPPLKRKRKEYDVKGRLQDLEEQHTFTSTKLEESESLINSMTNKLDSSQKVISQLMEFKMSLESDVKVKEIEKSVLAKELESVASVKEVCPRIT
jgi:hypothetical protein